MGILGNAVPGAGGGAYTIDNSLRFRSSASAYLNRTPASATNQQTWTYSTWIKLGSLSLTTQQFLLNSGTGDANRTQLTIDGGLTIGFTQVAGGSVTLNLVTSAVYRDPSAWYHIVIVADTTNATASNRAKIYVNGVQVTAFGSSTYWAQNTNSFINTTNAHYIGKYLNGSSNPSDLYQAETNFIDGQALTPSSFGATSSTTGVWQPKAYTGTYGTNGFYLKFTDVATTSGSNAGLGKDFSGNGNYWNTNNISITSGSTYDSMTDVPTLTSATASNFATLNAVSSQPSTAWSLSSGNLNLSQGYQGSPSTIAMSSGKWYWEVTGLTNTASNNLRVGIAPQGYSVGNSTPGDLTGSYAYSSNGYRGNSGTYVAYGSTYTDNDVIGVALDLDGGTLTFYKNGTSQGQAYSGISGTFFALTGSGSSTTMTLTCNFGQRPFAYTPPTGYVALNTYNLPTPTIGATASSQANKYFDATTYTGNGSSGKAVTNAGSFSPDFVWIKDRTSANYHGLFDRLRGAGYALYSNGTFTESAFNAQTLQSLDASGFTVGTNGDFNTNNNAYVGWQWKANGTGVTNTAGSITSTVSANTTSGFSIVTYTGNGSSGTVGHGLGVAPKMIIVKNRSTTADWPVYFSGITSATEVMRLNSTTAKLTGRSEWNSTLPTSTVFSVGNDSAVNTNGNNYVAYCFSEVAGFSRFGSYTGNGSSDGPFVFTGFKPRFVLFKISSGVNNWQIYDTARNTYNAVVNSLYPDLSNAEATDSGLDVLSNGFKLRGGSVNASGQTFIYAAFAENPFKYSLAR